ncbi:hypothetical protein HanRHA438_Chr04g0169291 [Helianthus annuus]|uniref:Uncharacterized protein n=1 Tax=Helianthus annuus TaxID=4232 RepID=A0A251UQK1_HELAN|nr:hypothetical protein HanXRQr2_Chr04g0159091 [Helianthus annuus]KAJ0580580.1 hypothetical protein HanHA300_Chr04g0130891 [Helianthus annuus]KAJ0588195.1 hypothetical protein HanIR_Chr04g0171791 [Helianthus annuus]KAJ0596539.1 hypothetical protein HanHA89_Chr04g0143951 [Helianthus annuus]KAJ0757197.1 hypothetical protein HanLR1_Chr04g0135851 [Helianthus annuus]
MPVIVPVMFLCFHGFLNHNKLSVMPPRSMAFFYLQFTPPSARIATEHPGAVVDEDVQSVVIARLVGRT